MPLTRKCCLAAVILALLVPLPAVWADGFVQTNLVTDNQAAHPAQVTDVNLKNPWGMSSSGTSPMWVSNNGSCNSTLYAVSPTDDTTIPNALIVTVPGAGNVTGQVYNAGSEFNADRFLFVSEDGTISGWRGTLGTTAEILQSPSPDNIYKGVGLADIGGHSYLYGANFRAGAINILKGDVLAPNLTGNFTDPNLPAGYAPFNIQNLGGTIYVTYAEQDANQTDEVAGAGLGIVTKFDLQGNLLGRLATGGTLNAPWGLAIAPAAFGDLAGDVLVGNFGDGRIGAFDPVTGMLIRQLTTPGGDPLVIDGLWALSPGNGGSGGSVDRIYFTAGPDGETHGLFGSIAVPEPATTALLLPGLVVFATRRGRTPIA